MKIQYVPARGRVYAAVQLSDDRQVYIKAYDDADAVISDHQQMVLSAAADKAPSEKEMLAESVARQKKQNWMQEEMEKRYRSGLEELGFVGLLSREVPKDIQDLLKSEPWFPMDRLYAPI